VTGLGRAATLLAFALRQLLRSPRRTLLTFVGLVISFFLYTALESMLYTLESVLDRTASETGIFLRARGRGGFFRAALPARYVDGVREVEGVVAASPVRFYFGLGRAEGSFAVALGVEAESYLRVRALEGIGEEEERAFRADRSGALVGRSLLDSNGWRVGERVTIRGAGRLPSLAFTIRGAIESQDRLGRVALVHLDYLDDVIGGAGRVSFIQARVRTPELAAVSARAIDLRFANFTVPTETTTERAHLATVLSNLSSVLAALRVIGGLTLAVTVLVVGNCVAMSVRERTVEIGTLRAVGYGRGRVLALVLVESVAVAAVGGAVGALAAWGSLEGGLFRLPAWIGFSLRSDATVMARAALLAVPVGLLAGFQPAWSAVRRPIHDALRAVE
jgi:putative ABC transport system permease protein